MNKVFSGEYYLNLEKPFINMVSKLKISGSEITIGDRRRPVADIIAVASTDAGIAVTFRDGSSDLADGSTADVFTIRDRCPWAMAII